MRHALPDLRERLVAMRDSLVEGIASSQHIDAGHLALLGSVRGALNALVKQGPADGEPVVRAIVSDAPGLPLVLALYAEDSRAAAVELSPARAIHLAGRLIEAAPRRLPGAARWSSNIRG